jgi:ketosteroid isomerase-like protein
MQAVDVWAQEHLAADFEMHPLYLAQVYRGVGAVREWFADAGEIWDDYRLETEDVIDLDEQVLVVGHVLGRGAGSGVPINQPLAMLITFEGEKVVRSKSFASKEQA